MRRGYQTKKKQIKKQNDVAAKVAEIEKPERPEYHPKNKGNWNGKYYGKTGNWNYYVNNQNYKLTDAEYAELIAYRNAIAAYNAEVERIKTN